MGRAAKWWVGIALLAGATFICVVAVAVYLTVDAAGGQRLLAEGYAAVQKGDCETAISKLDAALRTRLQKIAASYAHANRGYCYSTKALRQEALRDFDAAIELNPKLALGIRIQRSTLRLLGRCGEGAAGF